MSVKIPPRAATTMYIGHIKICSLYVYSVLQDAPKRDYNEGVTIRHLQSTNTSVSFTLTIYVVSCKMPPRATTMRESRLVRLERHEHLSVLHTHHIRSVLQDAPKRDYDCIYIGHIKTPLHYMHMGWLRLAGSLK